jgi:hypothetical protein
VFEHGLDFFCFVNRTDGMHVPTPTTSRCPPFFGGRPEPL